MRTPHVPFAALTVIMLAGCAAPPSSGEGEGEEGEGEEGEGEEGEGEEGEGEGEGDPCASCTEEQACIGGGCVDPVGDAEDYFAARGDRDASLATDWTLTALLDPQEECCFDFTGDDRVDDALGALVALSETFGSVENPVDTQGDLDDAIESGVWTSVIDWIELDTGGGPARFGVFDGALVGAPLLEDLRAGDGEVDLLVQSFSDPFGATVQANDASVVDGVLFASLPSMRVPMAGFGGGVIAVTATDVLLELALADCSGGVCTKAITRLDAEVEVEVPDARIGGLIGLDVYLEAFNADLRSCVCANVDPNQPVVTFGVDPKEGWQIECTDNVGDDGAACGDEDLRLCAQISTMCGFVSLIPDVADVDVDNDGFNDAFSFGARVGLSPVTVTGVGQ